MLEEDASQFRRGLLDVLQELGKQDLFFLTKVQERVVPVEAQEGLGHPRSLSPVCVRHRDQGACLHQSVMMIVRQRDKGSVSFRDDRLTLTPR